MEYSETSLEESKLLTNTAVNSLNKSLGKDVCNLNSIEDIVKKLEKTKLDMENKVSNRLIIFIK